VRFTASPFNIKVGIQFVQIGHSAQAAAFLKELDDGLASHYGIRVRFYILQQKEKAERLKNRTWWIPHLILER
jgi:hypothetical protein